MIVTTIVSEIVGLLITHDQGNSNGFSEVGEALKEIANSISEVSKSIDKLSDSVIATVQDEHELRHYGHLNTAIKSLSASRVDTIALKDAKIELDFAKKFCVSGVYWLCLLEYESLSNHVSSETLRQAFAYSQSDQHLEHQRATIYFYLFSLSISLGNDISQEIFPLLIESLSKLHVNEKERNKLAALLLDLSFLSQRNIELLEQFTQQPYNNIIDSSIRILDNLDCVPKTVEVIKLPILCYDKPVLADKNTLDRMEKLFDCIERLKPLIRRNNVVSKAISDLSYFAPLLYLFFAVILFAFSLYVWAGIILVGVIIGFIYMSFKRFIYRRRRSELTEELLSLKYKWREIIDELVNSNA